MSERDAQYEKILAAAKHLVEAIREPDRTSIQGKTISFTLAGEEDGLPADFGDWEIIIRPTRIPPGRNADLPQ